MKGKEGYLVDSKTGNAQFPITSFNCVIDPQGGRTLTDFSDGVEDEMESHSQRLNKLDSITADKTFVVFGDSIIDRSLWFPSAFRETGIVFKNYYKYGCSGASIRNDSTTTNGYDESVTFNGAIYNQVQKYWKDYTDGTIDPPDVILIDGGANDETSPSGTIEEVFDYQNAVMDYSTKQFASGFNAGDAVWRTVMGGLRCMVSFLQTKFPDALIILATPAPRVMLNDNVRTLSMCTSMRRIGDAVKEAGRWLGVDVIDKWEGCGINPDWEYQTRHYLADGVHPSNAGGRAIAKFMAARIREIVRWRL